MSWFVYAFVCALSLATADALSKKALDDNSDPSIIAWVRTGYTLPFMVINPAIKYENIFLKYVTIAA